MKTFFILLFLPHSQPEIGVGHSLIDPWHVLFTGCPDEFELVGHPYSERTLYRGKQTGIYNYSTFLCNGQGAKRSNPEIRDTANY